MLAAPESGSTWDTKQAGPATRKKFGKQRRQFTRTPLEIARAAGWDDNIADVETRVKTAIAALEHAGYVKRGRNVPRIYATGIIPTNAAEAGGMIDSFSDMDQSEKLHAHRVMDFLISRRSHGLVFYIQVGVYPGIAAIRNF